MREQRPGLHTQEQKADLVKGKDARASQKCVVYQLQLLGCRFRRAVRKRGKKIILDLTPTGEGCPAEPDERAASAAICDLLEAADAAICTIEKVGVMAQATSSLFRSANQIAEEMCPPTGCCCGIWSMTYGVQPRNLLSEPDSISYTAVHLTCLLPSGLRWVPGRQQPTLAAQSVAPGGGADAARSTHHPPQAGLPPG